MLNVIRFVYEGVKEHRKFECQWVPDLFAFVNSVRHEFHPNEDKVHRMYRNICRMDEVCLFLS